MASYFPMVKNTAQRIVFPILDADGDPVTGAAADTPDSEYSLDGAEFVDITDEIHEIATNSGVYYLDLAQGETNGDVVAIQIKTATAGTKTTVLVFYTSAQSLDTMDTNIDDIETDTMTTIPGTITTLQGNVTTILGTDLPAVKTVVDAITAAGPTKTEMDTAHALLATPAQVATELATYDAPTKAEMDTGHGLLATPAQVATAITNAKLDKLIVASGAVETSVSNSSTQVQTDLAEATNDHYNDMTILFTSGAEAGQARPILDYVGADGIVSWIKVLTGIPADDVTFIILANHQAPLLATTQASIDAITAAGPTKTEMDNGHAAIVADTEDIQTILGTPANFMADLSTLETRLSATRAGYLDELDFGLTEALSAISGYVDCLPASLGDIVTQTEAHVVDAVWDEALTGATHNIATSAGRRLRQAGVDAALIREDTCQGGGTASNVILDTGASGTNNFYDHMWIYITAGTGAGQVRTIHDYVGNTFTGDVYPDWLTTPDATSEYAIISLGSSHVHELENLALAQINAEVDGALDTAIPGASTAHSINERIKAIDDLTQASGDGDLASVKGTVEAIPTTAMRGTDDAATEAKQDVIDTNVDDIETIVNRLNTAMELDGAVYRFTENALEEAPSGTGASAASIADAVWDELEADHQTAATMGAALTDATEITLEED